jgi:hypothetical protein
MWGQVLFFVWHNMEDKEKPLHRGEHMYTNGEHTGVSKTQDLTP